MSYLVFSVLLCLAWLVAEHFPPWQAFHNEVPVFAALVLAFAAALALHRKLVYRVGLAHGTLLLLVLVALVQYGTGQLAFAGDIWLVITYLTGFALAWILGAAWADARQQTRFGPLETLALAFAAGSTVSALIAIIQSLGQEAAWMPWVMSAAHTNRAVANLAQPNQLSTLLLMGIVGTAMLRNMQLLSKHLLLVLVALQSTALVLTESRTGLLVVALMAILYGHVGRGNTRIQRPAVWIWAGAIWLGATAYQWVGGVVEEKVALGGTQMTQVGLRPLMWRQFGEALLQSPWGGYGWLQTPAAQQQGAMAVPGLEQVVYAHNQILDLAIWLGLPLTFALTVLVLLAVWRRRKAWQDPRVGLMVMWLLPVACHAMLEFPLTYAYFLLPVGVMLGMLDHWTKTEATQTWQLPRAALAVVLLAYGTLLIGLAGEYLQAEEDFRVARFENRRIGQTPESYHVPDFTLLTQYGAVLKAMRLRAEPGMRPDDLELLKQASRRYSWAPLHFRYALALGLNGQAEDAARQMKLIRGLFGEEAYAEAADNIRRLQQERYPELGRIRLL